MPHTSIKGQVLVDLIIELVESLLEEEGDKQNMDKNQLVWFPNKGLYPGGYTWMVQLIKEDLE